jgi:hypothetical protein
VIAYQPAAWPDLFAGVVVNAWILLAGSQR